MKLQDINRLDEALELSRQQILVEGLLSDFLASSWVDTLRWLEGHNKVVEKAGLGNYVAAAKKLGVSLLDDSPEANKWWDAMFNAVDKKYGTKLRKKNRAELIAQIKAKIEPSIDRSLENVQDRLEELHRNQASSGKRSMDVDRLFNALFGGEAPKSKRRRKTRREYAESKGNICTEDIGQTKVKALDMLNPRKRAYKGAEMIRASNNARIATTAISLLSQKLDSISVGDKLKKSFKKPPVPKTPLTRTYDMAMFVNKIRAAMKKPENKGQEEKFVAQLRRKAKTLGMSLANLQKVLNRKDPYPENFDEFRKRYGKSKPPLKPGDVVQAEVVDERT